MQWLIAHNVYYRHIQHHQEALSLLPQDGDISNLSSVTVNSPTEVVPEQTHETEDSYNAHLSQTFVPLNYQRSTEQEVVRQSVEQSNSHQSQASSSFSPPVVMWPQSGDMPINEFRTEGYMTCAFPTLFQTGTADFTAPRERQVTVGNYFKHLLMYKDGRFAKHHPLPVFCLKYGNAMACSFTAYGGKGACNSGSNSVAGLSQWLTLLVCQLCSFFFFFFFFFVYNNSA